MRAPWLPAWSAQTVSFGQGKCQRRIDRFAISLLLACQPHHLADLLAEDQEFASRFLFAWPDPPPHCALADCRPAAPLVNRALHALRATDPSALIPREALRRAGVRTAAGAGLLLLALVLAAPHLLRAGATAVPCPGAHYWQTVCMDTQRGATPAL